MAIKVLNHCRSLFFLSARFMLRRHAVRQATRKPPKQKMSWYSRKAVWARKSQALRSEVVLGSIGARRVTSDDINRAVRRNFVRRRTDRDMHVNGILRLLIVKPRKLVHVMTSFSRCHASRFFKNAQRFELEWNRQTLLCLIITHWGTVKCWFSLLFYESKDRSGGKSFDWKFKFEAVNENDSGAFH